MANTPTGKTVRNAVPKPTPAGKDFLHLAKGKARREPYTRNGYVRFDEEGMAERPFLYST